MNLKKIRENWLKEVKAIIKNKENYCKSCGIEIKKEDFVMLVDNDGQGGIQYAGTICQCPTCFKRDSEDPVEGCFG